MITKYLWYFIPVVLTFQALRLCSALIFLETQREVSNSVFGSNWKHEFLNQVSVLFASATLVERIIYLLLKDYYTFKTMAEVSLVFFPAFTHPRPGKHYNTYFFSLLFLPLVSFLSSLLTLPTLFFGGSIYDYCNVNQVSHWWWFRE